MRQRDYDKYKQQINEEWQKVDNDLCGQIKANTDSRDARLALLDQIRNGSKRKAIAKNVKRKAEKPLAEPVRPWVKAEPSLPLESEK